MKVSQVDTPTEPVADVQAAPASRGLESTLSDLFSKHVKPMADALGVESPAPNTVFLPKPGEPAPAPAPTPAGLPPADVLGTVPPAPKPVEPSQSPAGSDVPPEAKTNHAFAQLRADLKAAKDEVKRLSENTVPLAEVEAKIKLAVEAAKAESEKVVAGLQKQLGELDVALSPEFKSKYDQRLDEFFNKAVNLISKSGIDRGEAVRYLNQMIHVPTAQRAERFTEDLPALSGALVNILEDFDALRHDRSNAIQNWKATREAMKVETETRDKQGLSELAETVTNKAVKALRDEGNPFFTESQESPEWTRAVQARVEALRGLVADGEPDAVAVLIARGLSLEGYREMYNRLKAEFDAYRQKTDITFRNYPGVMSSSVQSQPATTGPQKPRSSEEVLQELLNKHVGNVPY